MLTLNDRLLTEVFRLIKEEGQWLIDEGSVNLHSYDWDDTTGVILQLHADTSLKPLFRVYEICRGEIGFGEQFHEFIRRTPVISIMGGAAFFNLIKRNLLVRLVRTPYTKGKEVRRCL